MNEMKTETYFTVNTYLCRNRALLWIERRSYKYRSEPDSGRNRHRSISKKKRNIFFERKWKKNKYKFGQIRFCFSTMSAFMLPLKSLVPASETAKWDINEKDEGTSGNGLVLWRPGQYTPDGVYTWLKIKKTIPWWKLTKKHMYICYYIQSMFCYVEVLFVDGNVVSELSENMDVCIQVARGLRLWLDLVLHRHECHTSDCWGPYRVICLFFTL